MAQGFDHLLDATITHLEALKAEGARSVSFSNESVQILREMLQERRERAEPAQSNRPFAQKPIARETVSRKESSVVTDAGKAQAADLVGRVADWPVLNAEEKLTAMRDLASRAGACTKCSHLVKSRSQVVFGVGSLDAEIMYVGEAPGLDEDRQGEPFVGKAGQLLTKIIQTMGLSREKVYIANVLKCRPDTPGQTYGNRKPTPLEMQTCWPYLLEQIKCIRPKVIVALGTTAVEGLLGKKNTGDHSATRKVRRLQGDPPHADLPPLLCAAESSQSNQAANMGRHAFCDAAAQSSCHITAGELLYILISDTHGTYPFS